MSIIKIQTSVNAPMKICFDLSRSIEFHIQSTSRTNEKAIGGKTAGLIELNDIVTWEATHFFIRQQLTSKITVFDSPFHFRDEMISGAFKSFKHDHFFRREKDKTLMLDIFEFQSPLGILGKLFNYIILEKYMENFLRERCELIKLTAESDEWKYFI